MSEYIKRNDVLEAFSNLQPSGFEQSLAGIVAINTVKAVPAADVVEVVRCRECKYRNTPDCICRDKNWFCADGKPKEVSE